MTEDLIEKYKYKKFDLEITRKYKINRKIESMKVREYGRDIYVASPFEFPYQCFLMDIYKEYKTPKDFSVRTHPSSSNGILLSFTFTIVNDENEDGDERCQPINTWVHFKYLSTDEDGFHIYELESFEGNIFKKSKPFFDSVIAFMDYTFEIVE